MNDNKAYRIVKDIQLMDGGKIRKNGLLQLTHGLYYLDGGLLSESYQRDFKELIQHEETNGWNYLRPQDFKLFANDFA